jgi:hypothetical protein
MQADFMKARDIIVMHPDMAEGIAIRGATMLIIAEPLADATKKQQVEARVVHVGTKTTTHVEIVTCITGFNLSGVAEGGGNFFSSIEAYLDTLAEQKSKLAKEVLTQPPWKSLGDIKHMMPGPEVVQAITMRNLEQYLDMLKQTIRKAAVHLHGKKSLSKQT